MARPKKKSDPEVVVDEERFVAALVDVNADLAVVEHHIGRRNARQASRVIAEARERLTELPDGDEEAAGLSAELDALQERVDEIPAYVETFPSRRVGQG